MNLQYTDVLGDLPRGRGNDHGGRIAASQFAAPQDVLQTAALQFDAAVNREGKIFLGVLGGELRQGERLQDGRPNRWIEGGTPIGLGDDRHVVTIAGSRAGKGRSALMPNLLTYLGSMLVIDPKGDLARLTAEYRSDAFGQEVVVLDPFGVSGEGTKRFQTTLNGLDILRDCPEDLLVPNARLIADSLMIPSGGNDRHWDDCASSFLGSGLCLHVAKHPKYESRRDLITVWELAAELTEPDPDNPEYYRLQLEMEQSNAAGGAVRAAAQAFYSRRGGEFSSVTSTLRKNLDWVSYACMHSVLRGLSVDLRDLKRKPMTVYATLPAMRMHDLGGWLRLLVQLSLAACEDIPDVPQHPVLFILDEFHCLGKLDSIQTAIAQIAGFGVKLWIILQDIGQLKQYGNSDTFIANAGCIQAFGNSDITTLEYLSKRLGNAQVINPSVNTPTYEQIVKQGASGQSCSLGTHPLQTPEEIARYFGRDDKLLRQLILRPGYRPMVLQRAFYDTHELFRDNMQGRSR